MKKGEQSDGQRRESIRRSRCTVESVTKWIIVCAAHAEAIRYASSSAKIRSCPAQAEFW